MPSELGALVFDAQTSGGLPIALPDSEASALLTDLRADGNLYVVIVGCIVQGVPFALELF